MTGSLCGEVNMSIRIQAKNGLSLFGSQKKTEEITSETMYLFADWRT